MRSDLNRVIEQLRSLDWRFSDYSPSLETTTISNLHWYPAPFVPHIPSILIKSLSERGDIILDPFCGTGVTGTEAARLDRRFVQYDINPLAVEIACAKHVAVQVLSQEFPTSVAREVWRAQVQEECPKELEACLEELRRWFHPRTLAQLLTLRELIADWSNESARLVLKVIFSSILHRTSSQTNHYSYVVDNCYPSVKLERDAFTAFLEQLNRAATAVSDFRRSLELNGLIPDLLALGLTKVADARKLTGLPDNSIDMVVTSPPYVSVNDYVKSQRLTYLFYPPFPLDADERDIGARRKRHRRAAVQEYLSDMRGAMDEMVRVTKPDGFICLALGQSSSTAATDVVGELVAYVEESLGSLTLLDVRRPISFRKIQNAGIGFERIVVLHKE